MHNIDSYEESTKEFSFQDEESSRDNQEQNVIVKIRIPNLCQ